MFSKKIITFFIIFLACLFFLSLSPKKSQAYYGGLYGVGFSGIGPNSSGLYGLGLYGIGLYGSSLYSSGLYNGLNYGLGLNNYNFGGLGLYGGLYGSGLYGSGLYGSGLYGSGLYGLSGLSGGLYGSLGLGGLYGLGRYSLSTGIEAFPRTANVLLPTGGTTSTTLIPTIPNPTGVYSGPWVSLAANNSGTMTMNIALDPLTDFIFGSAGLILNKIIPIPISVSGANAAPTFTLLGNYFDLQTFITYTMELYCTLTPAAGLIPATIEGDYAIHDALFLKFDYGFFTITQ